MRFAVGLGAALALVATPAFGKVVYEGTTSDTFFDWSPPSGVDNFAEGPNTFRIDISGGTLTRGTTSLFWEQASGSSGQDTCGFGGKSACKGTNTYLANFEWGDNYLQFTAIKPDSSFIFSENVHAEVSSPGSFSYRVSVSPEIASAVPEPASWGIVIGGMGMIGSALRRRKQRAPAL